LPRVVRVVTPENVTIEYELAGVASRGGAAAVDMLIQGVIMAVIISIKFALLWKSKSPLSQSGTAALGIAGFLVFYGYYVFFETLWNGRTPGKRYARLRAVRDGGLPMDLASAAIRNLVRVIDFLPVMYALGLIFMIAGGSYKRLGDYAAGTMVVKERPDSPASHDLAEDSDSGHSDVISSLELITTAEYQTAKRFIDRRAELLDSSRADVAARVATPIMQRLGIEETPGFDHAAFLAEICRRCSSERGMR